MEVEVPQLAIQAEQVGDQIIISLAVATSGTFNKFFLCTAEQNYQDIAKQLHDKICEAGNQARRAKSGILTVRDLPDSLKNGGNQHGAHRSAKR